MIVSFELQPTTASSDIFSPIIIRLNYSLPEVDAIMPEPGTPLPSMNNYPIFDHNIEPFIEKQVSISDCGGGSGGGLGTTLSLQSDVALCDAVVFTILRHLSLSSAALTASCSVIPVELLMSLSHDVGGRPLYLFPSTFPVMIVLSSPFLQITCPKKQNFHLRTISRSISLFPILSKTHALVFLFVHGILRTLL